MTLHLVSSAQDRNGSDAIRAARRILVTGGAGFIGSTIVDQLIGAGARDIVVLDNMVRGRVENLAYALSTDKVRLVEGDIRDSGLLRGLVSGCDLVFHQAALRITQCAVEPRAALEVMVDATFDLLEACIASGVRKVVMASSASIYGAAERFPTAEDHHPYGNRTLYGAAKSFGEGVLRAFNEMYGLDYVALRYFNAYGPRMDIHGRYTEVLIRWMERIEAGLPPIIMGDGSVSMDLVHVHDVARANILAATSSASDIVLNVGSGQETTLLELAALLSEAMGRPDLAPIFTEPRTVNAVPKRLSDTRLAREAIGFDAVVKLERGLADLLRWWRHAGGRYDPALPAVAGGE